MLAYNQVSLRIAKRVYALTITIRQIFSASEYCFLHHYASFSHTRDTTDVDVPAVYHQLNDTYHSSSESEIDIEDRPSTSKQKPTSNKNSREIEQEISQDWKLACRQLLETLWQCEDSIPFR